MSTKVSHAKTAKILFDLVATLEPRVKPLAQWFTEVVETTEKWSHAEGNQGVKRMKDILSYAWATILGEHPKTLEFVKSELGVPELAIPLVRRCSSFVKDGDPRFLSAVQSLVRITDLWEGIPEDAVVEKSLQVITDSRLPGTARDEIRRFSEFLPRFIEFYPSSPVVKAFRKSIHLDDSDQFLYRYSRGPNGPLTESAHLDILSLSNSKTASGGTLLDEVEKLQDLICNCADYSFRSNPEFGCLVLNSLGKNAETIRYSDLPGKLSLKPEKSGKIRIIAQPDYFSQVTMKPVHTWLNHVLRAFDTDYTFDQGRALPHIRQWQLEGSGFTASFDQSACTDRFPFSLQLEVLAYRFGKPVAEAIQTVMADRDWKITLPSGRTRTVRWSVGQPLGMYGSWPLMALTHHLLVQYCSWLAHGKTFRKSGPFNRYAICGDDIVIADPLVADRYRRVCSRLGMVINLSKSHISGGRSNIPPVSEFTKVTVVRGNPLRPIKPKQLEKALQDPRNAVPLLFDLHSSGYWHLRRSFLERWIRKIFPKEKKFLTTLITLPLEFGGLGFRDDRSIRRQIDQLQHRQIHPLLYFVAARIRSEMKKSWTALASLESIASVLPSDAFRKHPLVECMHHYADRVKNVFHLRDDRVPTIKEILSMLLVRGFHRFSGIAIGESTEKEHYPLTQPHEFDENRQEMPTSWMRALATVHKFSPSSISNLEDEVYAHARITEDPNWLSDRQFDLITSLTLGKRSAQGRKTLREA